MDIKLKKFIILFAKKLNEEQGIPSIQVSRLVKELQISRSTFYNYFHSKEDLFRESIDFILDDINSILVKDMLLDKTVINNLLYYLKDNCDIIEPYIRYYPNIEQYIADYTKGIIESSDIPFLHQVIENRWSIPYTYSLDIFSYSITMIICIWIRHGWQDSCEEITSYIMKVLDYQSD